jgi:hypothetical protein
VRPWIQAERERKREREREKEILIDLLIGKKGVVRGSSPQNSILASTPSSRSTWLTRKDKECAENSVMVPARENAEILLSSILQHEVYALNQQPKYMLLSLPESK